MMLRISRSSARLEVVGDDPGTVGDDLAPSQSRDQRLLVVELHHGGGIGPERHRHLAQVRVDHLPVELERGRRIRRQCQASARIRTATTNGGQNRRAAPAGVNTNASVPGTISGPPADSV